MKDKVSRIETLLVELHKVVVERSKQTTERGQPYEGVEGNESLILIGDSKHAVHVDKRRFQRAGSSNKADNGAGSALWSCWRQRVTYPDRRFRACSSCRQATVPAGGSSSKQWQSPHSETHEHGHPARWAHQVQLQGRSKLGAPAWFPHWRRSVQGDSIAS